DIAAQISKLKTDGRNRLFEATPELLRTYAEALESISHSITEAGRLYANKKAANTETLAEQSIREFQAEKREAAKVNATAGLRRMFDMDSLNPAYFAKKLGHSTEAVMNELFEGYYQTIANVRVVDDFLDGIREKYKVSTFTGKNEKLHSVKLERGGSVTLTTSQIMTLYALSDRPQAKKHLYGRGLQSFRGDVNEAIRKTQPWRERIGDEFKRFFGKDTADLSEFAKQLFGGADVKAVTERDVESMINLLTADQKDCVRDMKKFLHDVAAPMGNKTSQTLYLYDMFTEENYFPIETVNTFLKMTEKNQKDGDISSRSVFSILNKGFTKTLSEQAGNPIVIRDIFDVFTEHCFDMANYGGLGVAVSDVTRWLGYRQGGFAQKENSQTAGNVRVDSGVKTGYNETKTLTNAEAGAVLSYKSGQSYQLNALLRENPDVDSLPESFRDIVGNLDSALEKLPAYEGVTYRNIGFDDNGGKEMFDLFIKKHAEGQLVYYPAYTSTSTSVEGYPVDGEFVVHMEIQGVSGRNLDGFGNNMESEVLFSRESVFFIQKVVYDENGMPTIYMQEVNENGTGQLRSDQRSTAMRHMQARDSNESGLQGISERATERDHQRALGSQGALPRGQRDPLRTERSDLRSGSTVRQEQGQVRTENATSVREEMKQAWGAGAEASDR
ncbi:MAG: hypothetical protein IKV00_06750, partial [Clostridia bacterium]|nr:hypothetical protein [Clostridia bacterium]